jgi:hypothetical protein
LVSSSKVSSTKLKIHFCCDIFLFIFVINFKSMAELQVEQPKSLIRPKSWSTEVENAYRFQLAGYRDEKEYTALRKIDVSIFI